MRKSAQPVHNSARRVLLAGNIAIGGFTAEAVESAVKTRGGRNAPPTATPGTI